MNQTVASVSKENLCISCGICKAVCPKQCIEMNAFDDGLFHPVIKEGCVNCGVCYRACPGKGMNLRGDDCDSPDLFWTGPLVDSYVATSMNEELRHNAVSGGMVTEFIISALRSGYDCAFAVRSKNITRPLQCEIVMGEDELGQTQKSRYLPVSHQECIQYILQNRDKKVVVVGTPCLIEGFLNVVEQFGLNRENYLLLGLFCDKTMNYKVIDYFATDKRVNGAMEYLHFRSKDSGGYPGGVEIGTEKGTTYLDPYERMRLKDFFVPERCLYCVDKLNVNADVSIGDNYTSERLDDSNAGENTVMIRTKRGSMIWRETASRIVYKKISPADVSKSQRMSEKKRNLSFAKLKARRSEIELMAGLPAFVRNSEPTPSDKAEYRRRLGKLKLGIKYPDSKVQMTIRLGAGDVKMALIRLYGRLVKH